MPAVIVDQEVESPRLTGCTTTAAASAGSRGRPRPPGEVVSGAERDQTDRPASRPVARMQGRKDGVQAAVAACDDDLASVASTEDGVQLVGAGRGRDA